MQYHIAICDDEQVERKYLSQLAAQWAAGRCLYSQIDAFESAEQFLFAYREDISYDILLLDIQMKGLDGVTLAKEIRKTDTHVQIVFITGLPDFIAEGYEVSALHYLMKPIQPEKLWSVLDKAQKNLNKPKNPYSFPPEAKTFVFQSGIFWCAKATATQRRLPQKTDPMRCGRALPSWSSSLAPPLSAATVLTSRACAISTVLQKMRLFWMAEPHSRCPDGYTTPSIKRLSIILRGYRDGIIQFILWADD